MELTNDFRVSAPPPRTWEVLTDVERIAPMLPGAQLQEIQGDDFRGVVKVKVGPITAQYKGTASFAERNETEGRVVLKATGRDTRGQGNASATITATMTADGVGTRVTVVTDLTVTGKVAQFGRGVLADVSAKLIGQFVDALEADLEKEDAPAVSSPEKPSTWRSAATPGAERTASPPAAPPVDGEAAPATVADASAEAGASASGGAGSEGTAEIGAPSAPVAEAEAVIPDNAPGAVAAATHTASNGAAPSSPAADQPTIRHIDSPEPQPVDLLGAAGGSVAKRLVPLLGGIGVLILLLLIGRSRRNG